MFPIMFGSPAWQSTSKFSIMFPIPPRAPPRMPFPTWAQTGIDRISETAHNALGKQPKISLKSEIFRMYSFDQYMGVSEIELVRISM